MVNAAAVARPQNRHDEDVHARPILTATPSATPKRIRLAPMLTMILVMAVMILIPVALHVQMSIVSYQIYDQQVELSRLQKENASLRNTLETKQSARELAAAARAAGMVPAAQPGYISLHDGTISAGKPAQPLPVPPPINLTATDATAATPASPAAAGAVAEAAAGEAPAGETATAPASAAP